MAGNKSLHAASKAKNDEFYTQLCDIENELRHYRDHFKGKTVLCNCDDPRQSNFFHYFSYNFEQLGLKRLIATCYKNQSKDMFSNYDCERAIWLEYAGNSNGDKVPSAEEIGIQYFKGDGDFRSQECIELLKQADIVVTNPPFSLFRDYVSQLVKFNKKFLIIGNKNAITYKECFRLIMENKMWMGVTPIGKDWLFDVSAEEAANYISSRKQGSAYRLVDGVVKARSQSVWFTNLEHSKRHEDLILVKRYEPMAYSKFDNYDAINVREVIDIPYDYEGKMGVPISFLGKYNPAQFELIGLMASTAVDEINKGYPYINGVKKYARILIKRRQQ